MFARIIRTQSRNTMLRVARAMATLTLAGTLVLAERNLQERVESTLLGRTVEVPARAFIGSANVQVSQRFLADAVAVHAGRGRVRVMEPRDARHLPMAKALLPLATTLEEQMYLRSDLTFVVTDCEGGSPFYHAQSQTIVLCADTFAAIDELFARRTAGEKLATGAKTFVLLHELGHALIHIQQLPVVGREEDAADQFATYFSLKGSDEGGLHVLSAAELFNSLSERSTFVSDRQSADEHATPRQRMYNLRCWAYGSNPARMAWLVTEGHLPVERAERCMGELSSLDRAWTALLRETMQ
jgi:hypothetical protein